MSKTASGLVAYCRAQLGLPYWWGTFGNTASAALYAAKKKQYPTEYTASDFASQYGKRVHDCVGLVKGYRWSETPTSAPQYTASQDVNVGGLYKQCGDHKGPIASMPDQPGVCVFMANMSHVGVYIGGGEVIEARGHAYGVVKTKLAGRGWGYWGKPAWLTYDTETTGAETTPSVSSADSSLGEGAKKEETVMVSAKVLKYGSSGSAVKKLQILLNGLGYNCGTVDGSFGAKTSRAVADYQSANALTVDSVVGAVTWGKLIG